MLSPNPLLLLSSRYNTRVLDTILRLRFHQTIERATECRWKGRKRGMVNLLNLLFLLFLRYLLAYVFTWQEKFLLFLRHLRTSRGPSLPYKLQVFSFAKFVILAIFASMCFHFARKILTTFVIFTTFAAFSSL